MTRSSWRYRDWSDEAHRWYARVLVGFCVVCLVFTVVAIALDVHYGSEVLLHRERVSGTSHYTFDVSTEHITLALEGDLHLDEMDVDYTIYDTSDGRKVADDTLRVYDEEYEDYWTEVHHHVVKPGRYNLTLVQEPGVSGTFELFVNQTDLGPHEDWAMEITFVSTGFGLMCLGGLLLWFAGWRKERHPKVYERVQIYVWVCIMVLFLPTFAVIVI